MGLRIGMLGGIGPEATGNFYLRLIKKLQERGLIKKNEDFPQIIVNSIPAPELVYENLREKDLLPYVEGLKELESFGVDIIVMVCNTIHLFYDKLQRGVNVPIINLREQLKKYITKKKYRNVVVIGTPDVVHKRLFHFEDIDYIELSDDDITALSKAVFDFNRRFKTENQVKLVKSISKKYIDKGAETIILGCTEMALMMQDAHIPKIDTMDVLSDALVDYCYIKH